MFDKRAKVVREHIDAFSAQDWAKYRETLLPNAIYEERATGRKAEGYEAIRKVLETWTLAFPDLEGKVLNLLEQDDMVMAEILWEGTHKGLLKGPFGELPPTGKKGKINAVEVFHFDGHKIKEARHYFDVMSVLNQIKVPATAAV